MFVTNWISTTKIQKISEITNFFRHYFLSRTEVEMLKNPLQEYKSLYMSISNAEERSSWILRHPYETWHQHLEEWVSQVLEQLTTIIWLYE